MYYYESYEHHQALFYLYIVIYEYLQEQDANT